MKKGSQEKGSYKHKALIISDGSYKHTCTVLAKEQTESLSEDTIIEKLKQDIKILISSTEDARGQLNLMQYYKANKHQGKDFLENMLQDLTNGAFVFA